MTRALGLLLVLVFVVTASLATAQYCCIEGRCHQMMDEQCEEEGGYWVTDCTACRNVTAPPRDVTFPLERDSTFTDVPNGG